MGLTRRQQRVGLHVPRSDGNASGAARIAQRGAPLGTDFEIVFEHDRLPVEQKVKARISLDELQHAVDHVDEPRTERLECAVPLAIPMRVRNDDALHGAALNGRQ